MYKTEKRFFGLRLLHVESIIQLPMVLLMIKVINSSSNKWSRV